MLHSTNDFSNSSPLTINFNEEKLDGYKRFFSRTPLLSSVSANWTGQLVAYDYFPPGQMPEICCPHHSIAIFLDVPKVAQTERMIDGVYRSERIVQGDVVIVPANAHSKVNAHDGGSAVVLSVDPEELDRMRDETVGRDQLELIPHFATSDLFVHQLGLALRRALKDPRGVSLLYAESVITALNAHILQYYCAKEIVFPTYSGGLSKLQLRQTIDYIHANLNQALTLKELSNMVQMSAHYFSQLFKQSMGVTPHQYVIRCRVEHAQVLLKQKDAKIADVAKSVGFFDQSHLHRHFKRIVGITPRAFVKQTKP